MSLVRRGLEAPPLVRTVGTGREGVKTEAAALPDTSLIRWEIAPTMRSSARRGSGIDRRDDAEPLLQRGRGREAEILAVARADPEARFHLNSNSTSLDGGSPRDVLARLAPANPHSAVATTYETGPEKCPLMKQIFTPLDCGPRGG